MSSSPTVLSSTIGKKAVMAVTGVVLFGFVIAHLAGNLQMFLGPEEGATAMHEYAVMLRQMPVLLWGARLALLAALVGHVWAAIALMSTNADARPVPYHVPRPDRVTTYAARTMVWSGPIVGLYVVYHLLHLTFGYQPGFDGQNPYNNIVYGFQDWIVATVYVVANVLLGMHLFHGGWSWLQSLGASHPRWDALRKQAAMGLAVALAAGFVSIPVSVMLGIIEPADEGWFRAHHCAPELARTPGECGDLDAAEEMPTAPQDGTEPTAPPEGAAP